MAKWNADTHELDYPPTAAQLNHLRDLCAQTKTHTFDVISATRTRREASERIEGLIKLRRAQQRQRKRARLRAARLEAKRQR